MLSEYKWVLLVFCGYLGCVAVVAQDDAASRVSEKRDEVQYYSPIALAISSSRGEVYVVNATSDLVSVIDLDARAVVREIRTGPFPVDIVLGPEEKRAYVSCLYGKSVQAIDLDRGVLVDEVPVGYEPYGLSLSEDGSSLFVANSISNSVMAIDLSQMEVIYEVPVGRAPRYLTELPEAGLIAVSNGLSRFISFLDTKNGRIVDERTLERGSLMKDIASLEDGRFIVAAGLIAHDEMVTMQIERGWINSNGLYIVEVGAAKEPVVVPLDSLINGAANPWGLEVSNDGKRLYVSLAGVHEVAFVDVDKLVALVEETDDVAVVRLSQDVEVFDRRNLGKRYPTGGLGPRGLALDERRNELYVANYFSNDLSVLDAISGELKARIPLGEEVEMTLWRRGEFLFNDARICQQNYYSCASCHQEDGTMDGLNWDLINDGRGNPKNAKSLHDAMDTPPVMWSGVRANMIAGVAAGQRFLGFIPNEENHEALLEFIGNPRRAPNPYIGEDPDAEARGERVFYRSRCHVCHVPPTYADGRKHDLGLRASFELRSRFYTPSLRESYRTGPYLHHGFAESYESIFREYNPDDKHGLTSRLSESELKDLISFLKTL